jgi:sugar diacid utilization regulator
VPGKQQACAMTVSRDEFADLRQVMALCSELSSLAATDCDLQQIVTVVGERAGVWAAVVDDSLAVLALSTGRPGSILDSDPHAVSELIAAAARIRRALSLPALGAGAYSLVVAPILVGDAAVAYVVTAAHDAEETSEDARIMVTEYAAMVGAVILGRRRVVAIAAGHARRELFDGLVLIGERPDAAEWARHLGIEPDQRHRVLAMALSSPAGTPAPLATDMVEHIVATRRPDAIVVNRGTEVVVIAPGDDDASLRRMLTDLARLCRRTVTARFPDVRLVAGLSDPHDGVTGIGASYAEARRAVETAEVMAGASDVAVFADLGVHRLLSQVRDTGELGRFTRDVLGALIDYDRANGTDYCATLAAYLRENGSRQRAAALLHTHPNTVAYRVHRAEGIIGVDLGSYADRLTVQVALEVLAGSRAEHA